MNTLKYHYYNIISQDLLTKNLYKKSSALPKFIKVSLSAKLNDDYKQSALSLFEALTFNKPCLTQSKVNHLSLNLKKGQPAGVKITLRNEHLFDFLERFLVEIIPLFKHPKVTYKTKYAHIQFKEVLSFDETNNIYIYFQGINCLDIVIESSTLNPNLLEGCRIPLKK
jgi:ribosomal protein L5